MANSRLSEIRNIRLQKLEKLRALGIDPYPSKYSRDFIAIDLARKSKSEVDVVGRLWSFREHGNVIFADLRDASGQIQLMFQKKSLSDNFKTLKLIDAGDFLGVSGSIIKTQAGEVTVDVKSFELLGKSIRPMPDSWDGLTDKEIRYRRRYLDTNINPEVYQRFIRRSKFWEAHREFFKKKGFVEINIPVLEHIPGGGDANPFITHMDAIDQDFYLRISQELYLKRLVGGGYEKVYEIGPRFRNEGLSDEHLPEHIAMEFYWAYADWQDGMKFIKELYKYVIEYVYGDKKVFDIRGFKVDFSKDWEIIDFCEYMNKKYSIDVSDPSLKEIKKVLDSQKISHDPNISIPRGVDILWKQLRTQIGGPAFLINHPKYLSPLQKPSLNNPNIVERLQPIIAGSELGNGWSEVNDPIDQFERFSQQQKMREAGDKEAQWLDIDYVEMLEYGMPPTFGWGHSERLFWFLEDVTAREGVPFPQLKFELDEVTKEIYGIKDPPITKSNTNKDGYKISSVVKQKFPGVSFAYTIIRNIKIKKSDPELERFKANVLEFSKNLSLEEVSEISTIKSYRHMLKSTGVDTGSRRPSPEALIRRIVQGKNLYTINTAVDAYNIAVIETAVGLGGFDFVHIAEPVVLRLAKANEEMHLLGDEEITKTKEGELVYADAEKLLTLDLNYRDIDATKITENTKDIILFADGGPDIDPESVKSALQKGADYIVRFCGGKMSEIKLIQ